MSDATNLSSVQAIDLVRIDSNIWGGETSLNPKLLSPEVRAALPPKGLLKPGRIRIYPKGVLENLKAAYYRSYERARRMGVSIFDGNAFAVDPVLTPKLVSYMQADQQDFLAKKSQFLTDFQPVFDEWLAREWPAEWHAVVRGLLPPADFVERRLAFGWQIFSFAPSVQNDGLNSGGGFAESMEGLAGSAFEQLASQVATLWNKQRGGLADVKGWTKTPDYVQAIIDKAASTALFAPEIRVLADALKQAASLACRKGAKPEDTAMLKGLLIAAKDADSCRILCQSGDAALASAAQSAAAPWLPQPEPEPVVQSVPDCSVPLAPAAPTPAELAEAEAVCASLASAPEPEPEPEPVPQGQAMPDLSVVNPELAAMLGLLG
ncbi:MAG: hypothetical protein II595_08575 [Desulfovibrio sp.]|nr:hypothetical protein [Desulfovibrio sp.]